MANKNKTNFNYDLIFYISLVLIVFSLIYLGARLTGNAVATDTAIVNVTISSSTAINFTTDFLNLGSGTVNIGSTHATIDSEGNVVGGTGWGQTGNLVLENIGNEDAEIKISFGKSAQDYLGGTSPQYQFKFLDNEAGSCTNSTKMDTWINTSTTGTVICSNLAYEDSSDTIKVGIKLSIPSDATPGTRTDTVTATATSM